MPPPLLPFNRQVGPGGCLEIGEKLSEALQLNQIDNGFNQHCFLVCGERDEQLQVATGFGTCQIQKFYAKLILAMYEDDGATVGIMLYQLLGPNVEVNFKEAIGVFPAVTTVCTDQLTLIVLDGTRNFQQIALQGLTSIQRPTNQGPFSTVPLWWQASQWAHNISMDNGQVAGTPVFIAGHSYGGAVALVLAARYRFAAPDRLIRFLTYGSPKPGDQRLADLLETCEGMNLCNDNDLITVFPPDEVTLLPVMIALGAPQLAVWLDWKRPPFQVKQTNFGELEPNMLDATDFDTMFDVASKVITFQVINPISGHPTAEYIRRIKLRCPEDGWPNLEPCMPVAVPDEKSMGLTARLLTVKPDALVLTKRTIADGSALVLTKPPLPQGSLVFPLDGRDVGSAIGLDALQAASGELVLDGGTGCPCCPGSFTPSVLHVGVELPGLSAPSFFDLALVATEPHCKWEGTSPGDGIVLQFIAFWVDDDEPLFGTVRGEVTFEFFTGGIWETYVGGFANALSFTCVPFSFDETNLTFFSTGGAPVDVRMWVIGVD